jgi:hypothetical protein
MTTPTPSVYKRRGRTTRDPRPPTPWLGFVTLLSIMLIAAALAIAVQVGKDISYEEFLRPLHYVFLAVGFPGIVVGALVENNGHGITFQLHRTGNTICPYVNAIVYTITILLWLKFWGDKRLK